MLLPLQCTVPESTSPRCFPEWVNFAGADSIFSFLGADVFRCSLMPLFSILHQNRFMLGYPHSPTCKDKAVCFGVPICLRAEVDLQVTAIIDTLVAVLSTVHTLSLGRFQSCLPYLFMPFCWRTVSGYLWGCIARSLLQAANLLPRLGVLGDCYGQRCFKFTILRSHTIRFSRESPHALTAGSHDNICTERLVSRCELGGGDP
ncbi:uncharacterized protein BO95DRAFT_34645 [Aspergillus brunneoviolaceus CBS 621.78]|uniref:Uncharacterized protein n=1 Tax=Aspergillus brunneoviolaceus CBS 621.78 TaxID=1450534 RepID=A0ACD1FSP2_9EURO|nr:hypothetical protein BO95DRAFT_34645 [Aspergillus brunneoviolaceus CBS 621.78]RAH39930.1 hypothetical protein BO95DRAFT_34645 [Aspergillus brunneoviolaceus CBS 621.78]